MNRTTLLRLAASAVVAAGGAALATPASAAAAKTACDPKSLDNIGNSAYDYCLSQGFDSARVNVTCSGGQITNINVSCYNFA